MATNRHITPKPAQGWREWAAVWTLASWPPARVGQNSVTGFRHESGSAWAIAGRTNRTAIIAAMAAAGCRAGGMAADEGLAREERREAGGLAHDEGHHGEDQRLGGQHPASLRDGDQAGADHPRRVLGADAEHPEH